LNQSPEEECDPAPAGLGARELRPRAGPDKHFSELFLSKVALFAERNLSRSPLALKVEGGRLATPLKCR